MLVGEKGEAGRESKELGTGMGAGHFARSWLDHFLQLHAHAAFARKFQKEAVAWFARC